MRIDMSDMEENLLEPTLDRKANNINLSKRNVKSIIHHLLTNEHVIQLYKNVLGAHDSDKTPESPIKISTMETLDCFPKMTRSKVKDFMEKSNIPPSPCKKQKPGPSILDLDFAEEEDDDEYSPDKDENNETDDDESVISSYLSEFGSPMPVTPSTPVPQISSERPALNISPSFSSPISSATKRLKIDLSACEGLSETEEEETIALRTRSKKSLTDTSLVDIEQAFVAPDITADMYDTCYEDKDWAEFLNSLYKTTADESTLDDEVNDPEFNYIAEAEEEALDDEDFRFDKPTKVSRKELNSLIEELHNLFEDEVLPLQVVAEASNPQDPISHLVTGNRIECTTASQSADITQQVLFAPVVKPQNFSFSNSQNLETFSSPPNSQAVLAMTNQHIVCNQFSNSVPDSSLKVPYLLEPHAQGPAHTQFAEVIGSSPARQCSIQFEQKLLIEDNIRKHIQLLTQTFLLSKSEDHGDKHCVAKAAKEMLMDLNNQRCTAGHNSVMNVCNLGEAVQVVSDAFVEKDGMDYSRRNYKEELKTIIFNSPAFMYPHLLPSVEQTANKSKNLKSSNARTKFLPSEDNLIALGLEQFSDCTEAFPSELIHRYLIRGKTVNDIYHRIMFLSSSKAGINHVKKQRKLRQPVQLGPPPIHPVDFHPPKLKSLNVLPTWCKELHNAQASSSDSNISQRKGISQNGCFQCLSLQGGKLAPIKPKLPLRTQKNKSVLNSSVISIRNAGNSKSGIKRKETISQGQTPTSAELKTIGHRPSSSHISMSKETSQPPDLLEKAMTSCGIESHSDLTNTPTQSSSSTSLHTEMVKSSSVKNLAAAFDESERIVLESQRKEVIANSNIIDTEPVSIADQDVNMSFTPYYNLLDICEGFTIDNEEPLKDSVSENVQAESLLLTDLSKTCESMDESVQVEATSKYSQGDKLQYKDHKNVESDSAQKAGGAGLKHKVIQLTVIDKPHFEKSQQEVLKNPKKMCSKKDSSGIAFQKENLTDERTKKCNTNDKDVIAASKKRAQHNLSEAFGLIDEPTASVTFSSGEAATDETVDNGSNNQLAPWISSIISQFETEDSDMENKKAESNKSTFIRDSSEETNDTTVSSSTFHTPDPEFPEIPLEIFRSPESSPYKMTLISSASPKRSPSKLQPIAPKTSPCPKSVPYVPLPRISPKRKELNRQVRHILPKSFVFETKIPSPTKTTALNLKKKATLLYQKNPVKIPPRPVSASTDDGNTRTRPGNKSSMLTRSQRGRTKSKNGEESLHISVKRMKKTEEDYESAKETESEASEFEESCLSQEEDEDRTKLDDLMAASTTIRFGSKQHAVVDDDVKTKAEKKKALSLSLLQPDLVQNDPKKDDRDTAFAQLYFNQVKETLSSDPERFYKFLSLLKDLNKDHTNPVELYLDMVALLSGHHQLVEDFAGFLLSFQAVECQCFSTNFQYSQIRQFLRQVEINCGSSTNTYRKVLKAMSTWSSMCQEGKLEGSLREKMLGILKNVPGVLDNLISYFLDGTVTDCHSMDFEDVCLDEEEMREGNDEFENIILPHEREDYNTKTCTCKCHYNSQDGKFQRRIKHCVSCSLQVYEGRPVLKMSRNEIRPMCVVYPSEELEEKENLTEVKKEAGQIVVAKVKVQHQHKGIKRKGDSESIGPKSIKINKSIRKKEIHQNHNFQDNSNESGCKERSKTEVVINTKKKQVRRTEDKIQPMKKLDFVEKKSKTNKIEKQAVDSSSQTMNKLVVSEKGNLTCEHNMSGPKSVNPTNEKLETSNEGKINKGGISKKATKLQQKVNGCSSDANVEAKSARCHEKGACELFKPAKGNLTNRINSLPANLIGPSTDQNIETSKLDKASLTSKSRESHTESSGTSSDWNKNTSKRKRMSVTRKSNKSESKTETKTQKNEESLLSLQSYENEKKVEHVQEMPLDNACTYSADLPSNYSDKGKCLENTLENETSSELFDQCILDNLSEEGLTYEGVKSIHDKFPSRSMKWIQDRAEQLFLLLENMSDASTDAEDNTKVL